MGFLDVLKSAGNELKRAGGGVQDMGGAVIGVVQDLVGGINERDGYTPQTRTDAVLGRVGDLFGGAGDVAGGIAPGVIQHPVRHMMEGLQTAYKNVIDEPLSTLQTAIKLTESETFEKDTGQSGLSALLSGKTWKEAYKIAQTRSFGQASALGLKVDDILDEEELAAAAKTEWVSLFGGALDIATGMKLDPTVLGGKVKVTASSRYVTTAADGRLVVASKTLRNVKDIRTGAASERFAKFNAQVEKIKTESATPEIARARLADTHFADNPLAGHIAHWFIEADTPHERTLVFRSLAGDPKALDMLSDSKTHIAGQIAAKLDDRLYDTFRDDKYDLGRLKSRRDMVQAEVVSEFGDDLALLERRIQMGGVIDEVPGPTRLREALGLPGVNEARVAARQYVRREDTILHKSHFGRVVRMAGTRLPEAMVVLDDPASASQVVTRFVDALRLPEDMAAGMRARIVEAADGPSRQMVLEQIESQATKHLAEKAGLTVDEINAAYRAIAKERSQTAAIVKDRVFDGEGRSRIKIDDDHWINIPIMVTQQADLHVMPDPLALRKATGRIGQWKARHPNAPVPSEYMADLYAVWRPLALLRASYGLRNVGEGALRWMSKMGAQVVFEEWRNGSGDFLKTMEARFADRPMTPHGIGPGAPRGPKVNTRTDGPTVNGVTLQPAFGEVGAVPNVFFSRSSGAGRVDTTAIVAAESHIERRLRGTKINTSMTGDTPGYDQSWLKDVNLQIGQDAHAQLYLNGATAAEGAAWLKGTPEGREYLGRLAYWKGHADELADVVHGQVNSYLPTERLRTLAKEGKATAKDLHAEIQNPADRPIIHGEVLAQALGVSKIAGALSDISGTLFKWIGQKPDDALVRHRFFSAAYKAEAERLLTIATDRGRMVSPKDIERIQFRARNYALNEVKTTLYDMTARSELAQAARFISPFFAASEDAIRAWGKLAIERPDRVAKVYQAWLAPERLGLVVDRDGNTVDANSDVPAKDRYIRIPLPRWASDWPVVKDMRGGVMFNKDSANFIMQGMPGVGPIVTVPVNEYVKDNPRLAERVKFILPFGPSQNMTDLLIPGAYGDLLEDDDSSVRVALTNRIWADMMVDFRTGKRDKEPTFAEAKDKAGKVQSLRTVARLVGPVIAPPQFFSPYQAHIDAYNKARSKLREDPMALATADGRARDADEWFLDTYGDEYFALTVAITKNASGLAPTVESYEAANRYADLIDKHPELASLIVGPEGMGEYSPAVYTAQFGIPLRDGSGESQRAPLDLESAAAGVDERRGWLKFRQAADLIDNARLAAGLPNLQVKDAKPLAVLRKLAVEKIRAEHPEWAKVYDVRDEGAWDRKLAGFKALIDDPRTKDRDDIQGLAQYLQLRDGFQALLSTRKAKTLAASSNQQLVGVWESAVNRLLDENLPFGRLYYRWLQSDPISRGASV